jgi:hypothetical protein
MDMLRLLAQQLPGGVAAFVVFMLQIPADQNSLTVAALAMDMLLTT